MTHIHEISFEPAWFLVENIELLPKGRVLDVAMGNGRNAIYLAKIGFEVEGIDISPEAVDSALESARKVGVTLRAQVANLEGNYSIKKGAYDVIICFNYLQRSLIPQRLNDGLALHFFDHGEGGGDGQGLAAEGPGKKYFFHFGHDVGAAQNGGNRHAVAH